MGEDILATVSWKRLLVWVAVLAGVVTLGYALIFEPASQTAASPGADFAKRDAKTAQSVERFAALPVREPFGDLRSEVFPVRPTAPPAARAAPGAASAGRSTPPMPYRVAGRFWREGASEVVLTKGDRMYHVRQGEELDDGYRVTAVSNDEVTLL